MPFKRSKSSHKGGELEYDSNGEQIEHPSHPPDNRKNSLAMSPSADFYTEPTAVGNEKKSHASGGNSEDNPQSVEEPLDQLVEPTYKTASTVYTIVGAVLGLGLGCLLNKYNPGNITAEWIVLFGRIFRNCVGCLTIPLVFTSVSICFANLINSRKTRPVMMRMMVSLALLAISATVISIGISFLFTLGYEAHVGPSIEGVTAQIKLKCPNDLFIDQETGFCHATSLKDAAFLTISNITGIVVVDPDKARVDLTFPEQVAIFFDNVFVENIADAFATDQFLGVVVFSILVGASIVLTQDSLRDGQGRDKENSMLVLLKQVNIVLETILTWIIGYAPLAVFSELTYAFMMGSLTTEFIERCAVFVGALGVSLTIHLLIVCVGYFILVGKSPMHFFWHLLPGLFYFFSTGSYIAALPVLMRSIESSRQISRTLCQCAMSIGIAVSSCGAGAFYVTAIIYMAYTEGRAEELNVGNVILLVVVSTLSSFGDAHEQASARTTVMTIWMLVIDTDLPPSAFNYIVLSEWIISRMRRVHNVLVVSLVARILADQLDETAEDEEDRQSAGRIRHVGSY